MDRKPGWADWEKAAGSTPLIGPVVTQREVGGLELFNDPPTTGPERMWCLGGPDWQQPCRRYAGRGTDHPGVGECNLHGGNSKRGRMEAALLMAHVYAQARKIPPWQALLEEVSRCAGAIAWLDMKVAEAPDDEALLSSEPGVGYAPWVRMRNEERDRIAKVAKMTMDAGVASALVARAEISGAATARVLLNTLTALGLSDAQLDLARSHLRRELLSIAAEESATIVDGEVVDEIA